MLTRGQEAQHFNGDNNNRWSFKNKSNCVLLLNHFYFSMETFSVCICCDQNVIFMVAFMTCFFMHPHI